MVLINEVACKGCGICIAMCPVKILSFSKKFNETGFHFPEVSDQEKCVKCKNCMIYCPDFAMVVTGDEQYPAGNNAFLEGEYCLC